MADTSEGGAEEEKEGHSTGATMPAGIRAPTTVSLSGGKVRPVVNCIYLCRMAVRGQGNCLLKDSLIIIG